MTEITEGERGIESCVCCGERPADGVHGVGPHERPMCKACAKAWAWGWRAMTSELQSHLESLDEPS